MGKLNKAFHFLFHNPSEILAYGFMKTAGFISDDIYLKILYRLKMGRKLDLINPDTYNAKLQWLKLYDRDPKYTDMVDKYEAKRIAANIIGEDHIIPTYGIWNNFDEIDFSILPDQFVLKTTHGGGNRDVIICKNKNSFGIKSARNILTTSIRHNAIYKNFREWPYKNIKPRIIAEKYMVDESGQLNDYKFYCFNGIPKIVLIVTGRASKDGPFYDYFDNDFKHLPYRTKGAPNYNGKIAKPESFEKMLDVSKALAQGIPHVRIDLYNTSGEIYFGEWTFYDASGYDKYDPDEWDSKIGSWIKLPEQIK